MPPTRSPSTRGLLFTAALLAVVTAAYWAGRGLKAALVKPTPGERADGLAVDPQHLNFGEVWEDGAFGWVLPVENRGPSEVAIERFATSCDCTSIDPPSLTIPAGETRAVRLQLNLLWRKPVRAD